MDRLTLTCKADEVSESLLTQGPKYPQGLLPEHAMSLHVVQSQLYADIPRPCGRMGMQCARGCGLLQGAVACNDC